jgi:hypothetical protein
VKLLVLHPQILHQSCADCRRWLFDDRHRKLLRGGQPIERPAGVPTPCASCPKGDMATGEWFDRRADALRWLIALNYRVQATCGACLDRRQRRDGRLHHDLALVHTTLRRIERAQAAELSPSHLS